VIGSPPLAAGAAKLTKAAPFARRAERPVGGSGTVAGVTAEEADDSPLLPTAFVACTVNVYAVPFAKPLTAHGAAEQVAPTPPGDAVTRYPVIAAPPLPVGAVHCTLADAFPRSAETLVGASGTVAGVTGADADDSALLPTAFATRTVKLYAVPLVRPVTVHVVAAVAKHVRPPGDVVTV
jgi:hypothetical protein